MLFCYYLIYLAEYESGPDDMEHDVIHTALSTSGYAVGKKLLGMGLGGMNKDKLDEAKQNSVFHHQINASAPTKEDIIMQKKNKKVDFVVFCFACMLSFILCPIHLK